jgi:transposase
MELYWLTKEQIEQIGIYFPPSRGKPRVDDRRVLSGIVHVIKNGLRWCDAPAEYGPYKTLYNRFIRWSKRGVFDCIFRKLVLHQRHGEAIMIDATHLKTHRTVASLLKKGHLLASSVEPKAGLTRNSTPFATKEGARLI